MGIKKYGQLLGKVTRSFWSDLTTPKWLVAWNQLAAETGAELKRPWLWRAGHLLLQYRGFVIDLTNPLGEGEEGTLLQTLLPNETGFRFSIARKNVVSKLATALGFPRIHAGYADFDEVFSITGNSEQQLHKLLEDESLRDMLTSQPDVSLTLRKKPFDVSGKLTRGSASKVSLLAIETSKIVGDLATLKQLVKLQQRVLDRLCEQGVTPAA